ncbi:MAG: 5-formyltetrahydrofolate cyclo-ligase [Halioglobus sp.]|nr:5-formyltetrahydrofolate cyclo-ligase [Halioglobus sp.]
MENTPTTKVELRKLLRRRRNNLSPSQQCAAAQSLIASATQVPGSATAENIALYLATDNEIETTPLASRLRAQNSTLYLPVITGNGTLYFARWDNCAALVENRYGIPEPPTTSELLDAAQLDIIYLPVVGWDKFGTRLGMGGGFYDRSLANNQATRKVGLAHECQYIEALPRDSWDVSLDYIATGTALYRNKGQGQELDILFSEDNTGL